MKERLFVIASQRSVGKTWWIVGEKAGPRSRKFVKTWSFRTRAEAMRMIDTLGRLVEDLRHLPCLIRRPSLTGLNRSIDWSEPVYTGKSRNQPRCWANRPYEVFKR